MTEHRDNIRQDYEGIAEAPLVVTQRGKPVGVVVSPEVYDRLVELQDLAVRETWRKAEEAIAAGEGIDAQGMGARALEAAGAR
ncbi:MAG: type II toxin-antitoxin system Phd/YefM family antitoxin [Myxococcales bacterium]|nr:type II toxin-antitoxin system Phd/YefM family antitoxin [Myxococcales bacterium]